MAYLQPFPARPGRDASEPPSRSGIGPAPSLGVLIAAAFIAVGALAPRAAAAQLSPLLVEVRGGATLPSGGFLDGGTGWDGTGGGAPSFGADFTLVSADRWGWHAGFGQDRFECPAGTCDGEDELVATGFDLGLRLLLRSDSRIVPWIGAGGLSYRVERQTTERASTLTPRAWGWEAGAGVYIVLSERIYLDPSTRFRSLDLDRDGPGELRVRALVMDLGLVLAF